MTTRELFGASGITVRGRRWFLDRYRRGASADADRMIAGLSWVTDEPDGLRTGVAVFGPRHGLALFHTGEGP